MDVDRLRKDKEEDKEVPCARKTHLSPQEHEKTHNSVTMSHLRQAAKHDNVPFETG